LADTAKKPLFLVIVYFYIHVLRKGAFPRLSLKIAVLPTAGARRGTAGQKTPKKAGSLRGGLNYGAIFNRAVIQPDAAIST
jgi:hypothetical protein